MSFNENRPMATALGGFFYFEEGKTNGRFYT